MLLYVSWCLAWNSNAGNDNTTHEKAKWNTSRKWKDFIILWFLVFLTCLTWIPWIPVLPTLLGPFSEEGNGILFLDTSTQKSQDWHNWSIFAPCFSWDQNHRCLSGELPKKFPEKSQASPNVCCMMEIFTHTFFREQWSFSCNKANLSLNLLSRHLWTFLCDLEHIALPKSIPIISGAYHEILWSKLPENKIKQLISYD